MYGKKRLRSAALLLALLMMVLGLFSCKNQKKQPSGTGEKNTGGIPENRLPVPVEAEDNGMRDFKILMPETNTIDMPTEEGGNFVSQTLFRADSKIEEHLRVLISYTAIPGNWKNKNTFNNRLMGMSLSDYSEFDLIMAETSASYSYALQNCLVMDLTQIKELTLANPWYLDNMVETYGINGKLFGARSDASLTTYESLNVIYFNTAMIARLNLNDPYVAVLCEVFDVWSASLPPMLADVYDWVEQDLTADICNRTPIIYRRDRLRLLDSGFRYIEQTVSTVNHRVVTWALFENRESGEQFLVFGTHLDSQSESERLLEAQKIAEFTEQMRQQYNVPAVLMGDLNSTVTGSAYLELDQNTDFDSACAPGSYPGVDHILCTPEADVTGVGTDNSMASQTASDHRMVYADLSWSRT